METRIPYEKGLCYVDERETASKREEKKNGKNRTYNIIKSFNYTLWGKTRKKRNLGRKYLVPCI